MAWLRKVAELAPAGAIEQNPMWRKHVDETTSIAEAALLYHVSRDYIRDRILDGTLPAVRSTSSGTRASR